MPTALVFSIIYIAAMAVVVGWIFDLDLITEWASGRVSIKYLTAMLFCLWSASTLSSLVDAASYRIYGSLLASGTIILAMEPMLFDVLRSALPRDTGASQTVAPGLPSWATLICFVICGYERLNRILMPVVTLGRLAAASFIAIVALVALLGHAINLPTMYYYIPRISTGMALPTSLCFFAGATTLMYAWVQHRDDVAAALQEANGEIDHGFITE